MEKQALSLEDLRKVGRWATATDNVTMLPNGTYKLGVIEIKTSDIVGNDGISRKVQYPIIECEGHGTISMTKLLASRVKSEVPSLAKNNKSYFFPQVPVNTIFTGDLATVAVGLQNRTIELKKYDAKQQSGFPEKGKPWLSADEAIAEAKLVTKEVYQIVSVVGESL